MIYALTKAHWQVIARGYTFPQEGEVSDPVRVLSDQGLKVQNGKDGNNNPFYYITDSDGIKYGVSRLELEDLQDQGKLNLIGIKEHDERLKKAKGV